MLMASVPRLDRKWEETQALLKPVQIDLAGGCVYYDRCTEAGKDTCCTSEKPILVEVEPDHCVACYQPIHSQ